MKMGVSRKEINILLIILGIGIAVAAWFLIYSPNKEKTDALVAENASLKPKAEEYEAANARLDEYELGIVSNQNEINTLLEGFPSDVQLEDVVMFWANIDKAYPEILRFKDLEIEEVVPVGVKPVEGMSESENPDEAAEGEDVQVSVADYKMYRLPEGLNFICTYDGLKKICEYLETQGNRCSLNQIEVEYDEETGALTGYFWVNQFFLEGTEKEYSPTFIPAVPKGQSNLFHTSTIPLEELLELAQAEGTEKVERDVYGTREDVEDTDEEEEDED